MVIKNKKTSFLFPKLVVSGDIENFTDIKQDLIDWIYKFKEKNSGISKISNRGGWQSESKKIFVSEGFDKFAEYIVPSITELLKSYEIEKEIRIVQMWLNVNGPNSYNVCHRHPGSDLSGVLWIKQTPESGRFVFDDIDNVDQILTTNINPQYLKEKNMLPEIVPEYQDGTVILFPSMLTHRVEINETDEDRISISFNLKIT
tara:strand:- start:411 stop:1016 length:606 start_codon:yes stop_codon:yes gene_type:complete